MRTLEYYFGNSPPWPPVRRRTAPPIMLNIRKRPVGRSPKAQKSTSGSSSLSPEKRPRLVEYSDTGSEAEVTQSPTADEAMSTSSTNINEAGCSQEQRKYAKCNQKDKRRKWQSMHASME